MRRRVEGCRVKGSSLLVRWNCMPLRCACLLVCREVFRVRGDEEGDLCWLASPSEQTGAKALFVAVR